jgi:hypothetical protein
MTVSLGIMIVPPALVEAGTFPVLLLPVLLLLLLELLLSLLSLSSDMLGALACVL